MPAGTNNILIGENGDILARYRIPLNNNEVDYALQLPSDADSSDLSSEDNNPGVVEEGNQPAEEKKEGE